MARALCRALWPQTLCIFLLICGFFLAGFGAVAIQPEIAPENRPVMVVPLIGPIGPATAAFVARSIEDASGQASAIVLEMDTPGGLIDAMRSINQAILASDVPVIVFVYPSGARATSAGVYILYASHLAAMAPGTTVGAATPVTMGGGPADPETPDDPVSDLDEQGDDPASVTGNSEALRLKMVNDSVSAIRSLAELHGRNADWAERAVREGISLTAQSAYEQGVVELLAVDIASLLEQANGRGVEMPELGQVTLDLVGATIVRIEPNFADRFLTVITNPNIAFMLINIGFIGLLASFYNGLEPVTLLAGMVCLIVGFYGLNTLPVNYAGAALILLGLGMLVAEMFVLSHGVLALAGLVIFALGALMLVETDVEGLRLDWRLVIAMTAIMGGLVVSVVGFGLSVQRRGVSTGKEGLVGTTGTVLDWSEGRGHVFADGERWKAISHQFFNVGDKVRVTGTIGLSLVVTSAD